MFGKLFEVIQKEMQQKELRPFSLAEANDILCEMREIRVKGFEDLDEKFEKIGKLMMYSLEANYMAAIRFNKHETLERIQNGFVIAALLLIAASLAIHIGV